MHLPRRISLFIAAILAAIPYMLADYTIVIDAGHGGSDPGAEHHKAKEKDINLAVAKKMKSILDKKGYTVILTRDSDREMSLNERARIANRQGTDEVIFVSIHCNALPKKPGHSCADVHVHPKSSDASRSLATYILDHLVSDADRKKGSVISDRNFQVLRDTRMPAVLVEMDYLTNAEAAKFLNSSKGQKKLATAICNGICGYIDSRSPVTYKVQIYSSDTKLSVNHQMFRNVAGGVERYYEDGRYKYTAGNYTRRSDAEARQRVLKKTFSDAFVVKFRNGKRVK